MLLWSAAAAVGAAAVAFAGVADLAQLALRRLLQHWAWCPWLLAPIGFSGIAWLTRRYFVGAEGSGIPQTIYALRPDAGEKGRLLLRPKVVIGRVFLAGVGLLCGGSIGREGPTVHVGAVIVQGVSRWMPHGRVDAQRRALVLAGGAAGVAAAFNTPLAGIVFAIEELSKSFEERASGTTLTAVILAGVVAIALVGDYTYFGQPTIAPPAHVFSPMILVLAIACGLAGLRAVPSVASHWQRSDVSPVSRAACKRNDRSCLRCVVDWASQVWARSRAASLMGPGMAKLDLSLKTMHICPGCTRLRVPSQPSCPT